ncbi:hypothetical protein [Streptomyces sp. NPDC050504]|uniref:hypothetical protein n=1 Tax=Streptomyces sp. NPDC050504 TaxID=3365618 RepID=UPI0037B23BB6
MPSAVGLVEEHELAGRRRVDGLSEEADRIQAELAAAAQEWQEWVIARRRVSTVLAPHVGGIDDAEAAPEPRATDARSAPGQAAKPKSQVPVWREGLAWSVLSVDYQRILEALVERHRILQRPLTCQELATLFGLDVMSAKVEALQPKAKRLAARGWLAERQPGPFALTQGPATRGGAS